MSDRPGFSLEWRLSILRRDNFTCQNCGNCGKDLILEVDHIDGNPKNDADENLQTLCVKCHNNKHPWRWFKPKYRVFTFSERRRAFGH